MRIVAHHAVAAFGAYPEGSRLEQRLVVMCAERSRLILLDKRTLASAFASAPYFERHRRLYHKRLIIATHAKSSGYGLGYLKRPRVSAVLAMVLKHHGGRNGPGS